MHRLLERSAHNKVKKRKAIAPSGRKIEHKRRITYDISNSKSQEEIIKPSFENKITKNLRVYYISLFRIILLNSPHFEIDQMNSTVISHNIEKSLIKKYSAIPMKYESYGDKIVEV